ncbi:putative folate-biopterin transporter 7 [Hibiscus syriacus]|uniref:Folate-biopterin transporter 7 n=1 Tax=Hibiscus syriacus TaxID=106335 RepID=A0A6A3C8D1_HIBSY|nr:probable folate-biopterin transporter 7 [Hibiscus syriacus]KAE8723412.1 putative folate-biopterin transporter 7 [Hibiscus syriacus]
MSAKNDGKGKQAEKGKAKRIRSLLGVGYWVQGFRVFPWMVVNFFLKDGVKVDPSTLQILQNSANLPMVGKPLYGVVSDAVYISGQHRVPYIAIGASLQALSWVTIALLSRSNISIFTMSLFLLLSNFGAAIAEVANEAIVAEMTKSKTSQSASSGELQSFVWMSSAVGGILGNLLVGIAMDRFSSQSMFLFYGLLLVLQFLVTITVPERSLNLPKSPSHVGIRKQLSELSAALRKPEIANSIAWFAASYAVIPVLTGTMFFYQTQYLKIDTSVLGISKVFGQVVNLLWGVIYDRCLKSVRPRTLLQAIQATMVALMISDVLFVRGTYRLLGVPDSVYVVVFSGVLEILFIFKMLPFNVLIAQLCPPGCEGSLMAFVMSALALATIVSGYLGVALASCMGITENDFSGFPLGLQIQAVCTLLPIFFSSWIPDIWEHKTKTE